MITILDTKTPFPPVDKYLPEGIVAIGGDLSPQRLISAYSQGIFPWFNDEEPIIWWSPDPRMVLFPEELNISKSMAKLFKKKTFSATYNQAFRQVITQCSKVPRDGQDGTWITQDMIDAYCELNKLGYALSVEVWQDNQLVGGLYGIDLGNSTKNRGAQCINNTRALRKQLRSNFGQERSDVLAKQVTSSHQSEESDSIAKSKLFCGESMFSLVSNASKYGFISLVQKLQTQGYSLIDCQLHTDHLASLGAREISREAFLSYF